jgi:hypothetical protein
MVVKGDYTKPKKGATFNVKNNYDNLNVSCETVDKIELKSIILSFNSWFIAETDYKPTRKMEKLLQQIKNTIKLNMNKHFFNGMIIDVAEIPYTFDEMKSGYVSFEYTLFTNKNIRYNREEITMVMNELIDLIYNDYFKEPIDFTMCKSRVEFRGIIND